MTFPAPLPGLVIRYSYLWRSEYLCGQEEGVKDRPSAILFSVANANGKHRVVVLPITHTAPKNMDVAIEIPTPTKQRLGLDDSRSWIVVNEGNQFIWPGPDLRPSKSGDTSSIVFGMLPRGLYRQVKDKWLELFDARKSIVTRTE